MILKDSLDHSDNSPDHPAIKSEQSYICRGHTRTHAATDADRDIHSAALPDRFNLISEFYKIDQTAGIAATKQIIAAYPKAQIMIVTHHEDPKLRRAARDAGAKRYIVKEDLLSILEILTA